MSLPIHLEVIQAKRRSEGGGGGGAWYDAALYADADGSGSTDPTWVQWSAVTLVAGTATKLRVGTNNYQLPNYITLGLYNNSGTLLGQTASTQITADGVHEIDLISSVSVSAASYYVAQTSAVSNQHKIAIKSATGHRYRGNTSSSYTLPSSLPSSAYDDGYSYCMGVWVE